MADEILLPRFKIDNNLFYFLFFITVITEIGKILAL